MNDTMSGRRFCIIGGTGSFGHAMVEYLLNTNVLEIRVFSRDEKKQDDMKDWYAAYNDHTKRKRLSFFIGDVRTMSSSLKNALHGCTDVFYAAAMKQVPSCELFPFEAYQTNVVGVQNCIDAIADIPSIRTFTYLSTDKAVEPINTMGITKALGEKLVLNAVKNNPRVYFNITRYGNVLCSRNSVIPKFIESIYKNKSITIYQKINPMDNKFSSMTRFVMSLDDAIKLVAYACDQETTAGIYLIKPRSAYIEAIAQALIHITDVPAKIKYAPARDGEKLHEILVSEAEEYSLYEDYHGYYRIGTRGENPATKLISTFNSGYSDNLLTVKELVYILQADPYVQELIHIHEGRV